MLGRRTLRVLAIVVVGLLSASCGGESSGQAQVSANIELPLEPFWSRSVESRTAVNAAISQAAAACMSAAGFSYVAPPAKAEMQETASRYGLSDLASASSSGYHLPTNEQQTPLDDTDLLPKDPAQRAAYQRALTGDETPQSIVKVFDPNGNEIGSFYRAGCLSKAEQQVFGNWPKVEGLRMTLDRLQSDAYGRAANDEQVRRVVRKWLECLQAAGVQIDDPDEFANRDWGRDVTAKEINTAVADVECKERTNYVAVWRSVEARYQQDLLEDYPEAMPDYQRLWDDTVRRAMRLLRGTSD